ncbi:MAG: right-handed parallel beta-helix repeat-containing protein [Bifidobacteriaceae bacterium]|nr:right-handed parallel beta-helix repeat-containing protein [Bifidobacteriaceae bacterium]
MKKKHIFINKQSPGLLILSLALSLAIMLTPAFVATPRVFAEEATSSTRVVFSEDFSTNSQWVESKKYIKNGVAHILGGGPENRIITKGTVNAHDFVETFDLWLGSKNTQSNLKMVFFSDDKGANRFQINYNCVQKQLLLQRLVNNKATNLTTVENVFWPINEGKDPYKAAITVSGDTVKFALDGVTLLENNAAGVRDLEYGHIAFASQFPQQEWIIDNIKITTDEIEQIGKYTITTKTQTNGVDDTDPQNAGGTVSANRNTGNDGDSVALAVTVKPGYVFEGYASYRADTNTSTDGLLPIVNDVFTLNDKTGSVIIVAKFKTEPDEPTELFKDYFNTALDSSKYTQSSNASIAIENGEMVVTNTSTDLAWVQAKNDNIADLINYRLEGTITNSDATNPQVAFRSNTVNDRYVVDFDASNIYIRHITDTSNEVLAQAAYTLANQKTPFTIVVEDGVVSVSMNNLPVVSYNANNDAGWDTTKPSAYYIVKNNGGKVSFDNLKVIKMPVYVKVNTAVTVNGSADDEFKSGALILNKYTSFAGDTISMTPVAKGGYVLNKITVNNTAVTNNSYTVPEDTKSDFTIVADFVKQETTAKTYYVDSVNGNDANTGLSEDSPVRSLPTAANIFNPGDKILIKRGSVFNGAAAELRFTGSGAKDNPIIVGAYGEGNLPQLNGNGELTNVVSLKNQEYITIENIEITNTDPKYNATFELNSSNNTVKVLRAVNVSAVNFGVVHNITIRNLYIHSINGHLNNKWNGGIFFDAGGTVEGKEIRGTKTKYDNVLIENNVIENVDRSGIKLVSSTWCNQSARNAPNVPIHWYPSTNVIVRNNAFNRIGGDGITVRDTDGALVEHNLVRHTRYQNTGYNAGIWPFEASNTVIQYNEVSHTHGTQDGQGLDCDHASSYSVMQYNYSHDNEGGFMLIMHGYEHTAPTIRFNISQNDNDKTFEFSQGMAGGTMIYNNTISSDRPIIGPYGAVFGLANSKVGQGNREVYIFNNIFNLTKGQQWYAGETETLRKQLKLYNNAYKNVEVPEVEEKAIIVPDDEDIPIALPSDNSTATKAINGITSPDSFKSLKLKEGSVLANSGITLKEAVDYWSGTITDRRDVSPSELEVQSKQGKSIDYAAGWYLPSVEGVPYDTDFYGNPLPENTNSRSSNNALNASMFVGAGLADYVAPENDGDKTPKDEEETPEVKTPKDEEETPAKAKDPADEKTTAPISAIASLETDGPASTANTGKKDGAQSKNTKNTSGKIKVLLARTGINLNVLVLLTSTLTLIGAGLFVVRFKKSR